LRLLLLHLKKEITSEEATTNNQQQPTTNNQRQPTTAIYNFCPQRKTQRTNERQSKGLDVEGLRFFRAGELHTWPAQRRLSHPLIAYRTYRMRALSQNGYGNSCFVMKLLYI